MTDIKNFNQTVIFIKKIHAKRDLLKNKYGWLPEKDARVGIFDTWINAVNNTLLSTIFYIENLKDNNWWLKNFDGIPKKERLFREKQYENILRLSFCQFVLQDIESSLRIILRTIDQKACSDGTASFENVYCFMLKKTNLSTYKNTFKLMRLIRNTVHNNSFYFEKENESVVFHNIEYKFEVGKPLNFLSWEFILELQDELLEIIVQMIDNPYISSLPFLESTGELI
ncbi:MAG: hypothetical protein WCO65_02800 [bacterium]